MLSLNNFEIVQDGLQYHDPANPTASQPKILSSVPPPASASWENGPMISNEVLEPRSQSALQSSLQILKEIIALFLVRGADVSIQDKVCGSTRSPFIPLCVEWKEYISSRS